MKRIRQAWIVSGWLLCGMSSVLYGEGKLPTDSCMDRNNLTLLRSCNPYNPGFLFVEDRDLPPAAKGKRPISSRSVPKVGTFGKRSAMTLETLVERYIDYKERMLERRLSQKGQVHASVPKKEPIKSSAKVYRPMPASEENRSLKKLVVLRKIPKPVSKKKVMAEKTTVSRKSEASMRVAKRCKALASQPYRLRRGVGDLFRQNRRLGILIPPSVAPGWTNVPSQEKRVPQSGGMLVYRVGKGDTFLRLARKYGTTVYDLKRWNDLKPDHLLKIGERLKIYPGKKTSPEKIRQAELRARSGRYKVVQGDTLIGIARRFDLDRQEIRRLNGMKKGAPLRLGATLLLPIPQKKIDRILAQEKKERILAERKKKREAQKRALLKRQYVFKYVGDKRFRHKIRVIATAYTSHRDQTDRTPFLAAWNNRIRPGMKIIAVSKDLIRKYGITNGTRVKISGLPGTYVVRDKMHPKWRRKIDIYMGTNRRRALRWGRRSVLLYW